MKSGRKAKSKICQQVNFSCKLQNLKHVFPDHCFAFFVILLVHVEAWKVMGSKLTVQYRHGVGPTTMLKLVVGRSGRWISEYRVYMFCVFRQALLWSLCYPQWILALFSHQRSPFPELGRTGTHGESDGPIVCGWPGAYPTLLSEPSPRCRANSGRRAKAWMDPKDAVEDYARLE